MRRSSRIRWTVVRVGPITACVISLARHDYDCYVIADFPDSASATAVALTVNASGAVAVKTTVLITPEEVDIAVKKSPSYRAPGQ